MENNTIVTQMDNLLSHLRYYRGLSDSEIRQSKDIISNFLDNLNSLINCGIDELLNNDDLSLCYSVNQDRLDFWGIMSCSGRWSSLLKMSKQIKEKIVKWHIKLDFEDTQFDNNLEEFISEKFSVLNPEWEIKTEQIDSFLCWIFNYIESNTYLRKKAYEDFVEIRKFCFEIQEVVRIAKNFYIDQFLLFEEFMFNKSIYKNKELSCEVLKGLLDAAIVILTELKAPCFIGEHGERILITFNTKKNQEDVNQIEETNNLSSRQIVSDIDILRKEYIEVDANLDKTKNKLIGKYNFDCIEKNLTELLLQGKTNEEMVKETGYNISTVKYNLSKIYKKVLAYDDSGRGSRYKAIEALKNCYKQV